MDRRALLGALGIATASGLAGCLARLTTFSAAPATVSDDAVSEAGYRNDGTEEWIERRTVAGRTVEVTNWIAEYNRSVDAGGIDAFGAIGDVSSVDAGIFAVVASPQIGVFGRSVNPLDDMEGEEVLEAVSDEYDSLSIGDKRENWTAEILDGERDVETFDAEATLAGGEMVGVELLVEVTRVDTADDHLLFLGAYPADLPGERARVETLLRGVDQDS